MADSSGNSFLGLIPGGVVVVLAIVDFIVFSNGNFGGDDTRTVKIEAPKLTK